MMIGDKAIGNIDDLEQCLAQISRGGRRTARPFVTVSYAQSLDGSIATKDRRPLQISGRASMILTHRLRTLFDGIMVGIETVLSDNPQLSVRLVEGPSPQPVVLDTHLRIPMGSRLLQRTDRRSWVASSQAGRTEKADALARAGVTILPCALDDYGRIDLFSLMDLLRDRGIDSLMVEGGARVITSFIRAGLVDLFVITVSPSMIGGLQVVNGNGAMPLRRLHLTGICYERLGNDMIIWARPHWQVS